MPFYEGMKRVNSGMMLFFAGYRRLDQSWVLPRYGVPEECIMIDTFRDAAKVLVGTLSEQPELAKAMACRSVILADKAAFEDIYRVARGRVAQPG